MTEEEKKEYENLISHKEHINAQGQEWDIDCFSFNALQIIIDWLNEHHFDYRNLIEKELALQAPDNMYIKNNNIDIRKELLRGFKSLNTIDVWNGIKRQDIIDWLENQVQKSLPNVSKEITKDKKSATSFLKSAGIMNEKGELAKEYRNDTEDKPTLKFFQEGDWIVYNNEVCQITHRENGFNLLTNIYGVQKEPVNERNLSTARHWTIQDAKPGDVLATDKSIFIFKQEYMAEKPEAYTGIMNNMFIANPKGCFTNENCHPATTEQKDILFQVMKTEGYEWDQEKKELKKIDQNPAWSEDDESNLNSAIYYIRREPYRECDVEPIVEWLRILKDRVQPQPKQEWSKEDEEHIMAIDLAVNRCDGKWDCCGEKCPISEHSPWLKSLKERYTWKPSDEQLRVLDLAIRCGINRGTTEETNLISLYNDLKKL